MSLICSRAADLWLGQFKIPADRALATKLLQNFVFISADDFQRDLKALIASKLPAPSTAAFYIERELKQVKPKWPYKQPDNRKIVTRLSPRKIAEKMYLEVGRPRGRGLPKKWTAHGSALPAVKSPKNRQQDIGSEGVVAMAISKFCKLRKNRFALQPHTNDLTPGKATYLVVVTDFIGSGKRSRDMLDALWRLASVRSWHSSGYRKLMVFAYSGTDAGIAHVKRHPSRPNVHVVRTCPTIKSAFRSKTAQEIISLCRRLPQNAREPLGFRDTGALMAFQHSCPNNVPAMFIESAQKGQHRWQPLFPSRTTEGINHVISADPAQQSSEAFDALRLGNIVRNKSFLRSTEEQQDVVRLLAAVFRGKRQTEDLVAASLLPYVRVIAAFDRAIQQKLLTTNGRITSEGHAFINHLNQKASTSTLAPASPSPYYYPLSLRAPP
ncbi:phosphoribosyltransferase-like protein [Ottowia thiooxydans]|uniref:Uncharacterized protein n=1 Tax=Ottowia thiooxydans TaxID=219182 RepID=A0ABV2QDQ9_9BURK